MSLGSQIAFNESSIGFLSMSTAFKLSAISLMTSLDAESKLWIKAYETKDNNFNPYRNLSSVDRFGLTERYRVILFLLGMSLELGLKALIKKSKPESTPDETHDLSTLATKASFELNDKEIEILKFLSHVVQWAGKYKVPNRSSAKTDSEDIDFFSVAPEFEDYKPYWVVQQDNDRNKHPKLIQETKEKVRSYKKEDIKYLNTDNNIYSSWLVKNYGETINILEKIHDVDFWFNNPKQEEVTL